MPMSAPRIAAGNYGIVGYWLIAGYSNLRVCSADRCSKVASSKANKPITIIKNPNWCGWIRLLLCEAFGCATRKNCLMPNPKLINEVAVLTQESMVLS